MTLTACSTSDSPATAPSGGSSSSAAAAGAQCPQSAQPPPGAGGGPGAAGGQPAPTLVVQPDASTSTVIDPGTTEQIRCGRTPLDTHADVTFASPALASGGTLDLKLDVQVPKTTGAKPLVVYVPGGGFAAAIKENALDTRTFVAEAGYVVASIQYRTIRNGATYTDGVSDVKSAIRFLRAHAGDYGIDPARVAVWGESAGGYLASMTGVSGGLKEFESGPELGQSSEVKAVVDKFGAADLTKIGADFDAASREALDGPGNPFAAYVLGPAAGRNLADDPAAMAASNPVTYITPNDPPFLHLHGTADTVVSPSETLTLHNALNAGSVKSTRYLVTGAGHGDLAFAGDPGKALQWTTPEVMGLIVDFFGANLK